VYLTEGSHIAAPQEILSDQCSVRVGLTHPRIGMAVEPVAGRYRCAM